MAIQWFRSFIGCMYMCKHKQNFIVDFKMASSNLRNFNFRDMPSSKEAAITWAQDCGLLRKFKKCRTHRCKMKIYNNNHGIGRFRCPVGRNRCRQYSLTVDSFFVDVRLSLGDAIRLMYCFARDLSYDDTAHEMSNFNSQDESKISSNTIAAWYYYCREMIIDYFLRIQMDKPKLGGVSANGNTIVVQIDEAKFGKRKYNRGRRVEGHWVLGMVDLDTNDCRMAVVEDRTSDMLIEKIKENVIVGSEIHTDCFRSYEGLAAAGYIHKTVNRSIEFVGCDAIRTQKIESYCRPAKDWMRGRGRFNDEDFADRLCEYLWRRFCRHNNISLFESLVEAIRMQYVFQ